MKSKVQFHSFFLTGVVSLALLLGSVFVPSPKDSFSYAQALAPRRALNVTSNNDAPVDVDQTTEAPADLSVVINSATSTSRCKRLRVTFSTTVIKSSCDESQLFWIVIDDDRYDPDKGFEKNVAKEGAFAEDEEVVFNGYTIAIGPENPDDSDESDVYIPEYLRRGSSWKIKNTLIETEACSEFDDIKNIYIPKGITNVSYHAFTNVPADVTFYIEHESKPAGWDDNWTDGGNIVWNYQEIPEKKKSVARYATLPREHGKAADYFLGYVDPAVPELNKPLTTSYTVKTASGENETKWQVLPVANDMNKYDAIGENLGASSFSRIVELDFDEGDILDSNSITFYNIFPLRSEGEKLPDTSYNYSKIARKKFTEEVNVNDYIACSFKATTSFLHYTAVTMTVDKVSPSPYFVEKAAFCDENVEFIESGRYVLRYAFYGLNQCSYEIAYQGKDGIVEKEIRVKTPISTFELSKDKNNSMIFLIDNNDVGSDFNASTLKEFAINNLTLNIHYIDIQNYSKNKKSELSQTFGLYEVMPMNAELNLFSIDTLFAIVFPAYIAVFAFASLGLYFYLREKYKNDEFRRMKTKPFVIKAIISGVASSIVLLAVLSIVLRLTIFNNSIVVFNPFDMFIVFAGIASILIIGLFIRSIYISIKNEIHRRQVLRLKLNQDVEDDGTN